MGVEETTRFFAFDGLRRLGVETRGDGGVVRTCRLIKSPAEIALMQAAADITVAAYRETGPRIARGMTPADIGLHHVSGDGEARRDSRVHIGVAG